MYMYISVYNQSVFTLRTVLHPLLSYICCSVCVCVVCVCVCVCVCCACACVCVFVCAGNPMIRLKSTATVRQGI